PDPGLAVLAAAEEEDPRVLEEATQDRVDPDRLAQPLDARTDRADPPHPDVDLHPGGTRAVQRVDGRLVDEGVDLEGDVAVTRAPLPLDLGLDPLQQAVADGAWRDEQALELAAGCHPGELVEQPGQVLPDLRVGGEQPEV